VELSGLSSERGAEALLKTFNDNLKPRKAQEARELYAAGSREAGILSRQSGEPMPSYVSSGQLFRVLIATSRFRT